LFLINALMLAKVNLLIQQPIMNRVLSEIIPIQNTHVFLIGTTCFNKELNNKIKVYIIYNKKYE